MSNSEKPKFLKIKKHSSKLIVFVVIFFLNIFFTNCTGFESVNNNSFDFRSKNDISIPFNQFQAVINKNCVACHGASDSPNQKILDFNLTSPAAWLDLPTQVIIPGKPLSSSLYFRLEKSRGNSSQPKNMPYAADGIPNTMTSAEADIIYNYILQLGNQPPRELTLDSGKINYSPNEAKNLIQNFSFNQNEIKIFPIQQMLKRLEKIVGSANSNLLSDLRSKREQLGDYNFSAGTPESLALTSQQNQLWMTGLLPICESNSINQQYGWGNKFNQFITKAYGRQRSSTDDELIDRINDINVSNDERFKIGCLAILGSLEFRASTLSSSSENENLLVYANNLKISLIGDSLSSEESSKIENRGISSIEDIVTEWTSDEQFYQSAKRLVDRILQTSGQSGDINYNYPGNLARYVASNNLPIGEIVTANYCVSDEGQKIECDTGAPVSAGLFTTKAFLTTYKGVFNIARSGGVMSLLCAEYPLPENKEPRLEQDRIIDFFATNSGNVNFGNGNNCYSCHSQMGLHAQLFVNFDIDGNYDANASGLPIENESAVAGFSPNGLFQSHMKAPDEARSGETRIFGREVSSISEGGEVISKRPEFLRCMVRHMLGKTLRLDDTDQEHLDDKAIEYLLDQAIIKNQEPSYKDLIISIFTDTNIIQRFSR